MAFKRGLVLGFGVGYVLGARAGRERYEDIRGWWNQLTGSPRVRRAADRTKEVAAGTAQRGLSVVRRGGGAKDQDQGAASGLGNEGAQGRDPGTDPWRGSEVPDTPEGNLP